MVENNQRDSWFLINVRLTDLLWMNVVLSPLSKNNNRLLVLYALASNP